jgi:hypothetical protein
LRWDAGDHVPCIAHPALFGRERIEITDTLLTDWGAPLPWPRRRSYDVNHIRRLRAAGSTGSDLWSLFTGVLTFDYGARTIRVGAGIDEAEAIMIIDVIARRFPQLAPGPI